MQYVNDSNGPAPHGPYSHSIRSGNLLYTSGQVPFDPATNTLVGADITEQTNQVMKNIAQLLAVSGLQLSDIVKTTVFLKNWDDFGAFNAEYAKHLKDHKPARSTVEVSGLIPGCLLEIEAIVEFPA